jgi:protein SCO1
VQTTMLQSAYARLGLLVLVMGCGGAWAAGQQAAAAHHPEQAEAKAQSSSPSGPTKVSIPDVSVMDQDGRRLHFYSDLVKGKTVAINFVFTTCTTICPPMTANFAKVQKMMLERGEKDFQLISVSVDPENDSPARLKAYADLFHAKPGWTFVTGARAELEPVWKAFGVFSGGAKEDHAPTVVIGNDAQHIWTYASGLTSPAKLVNAIAAVLDGKNANKTLANGN